MTTRVNHENIAMRVEEVVRAHVGSDSVLSPDVDLLEDLAVDSLELVELGVTLEKMFGVVLPDEDVRHCVTLSDLIQLVEQVTREDKAGRV